MKKIDTEGEHMLPVSIFFSQSFSAANFSKYGANSSFSYAYPAMNTQSIKSRVISGSSCSARMRFHSSFACWLSSASSRFRSSKRPSSMRFKSSGRKSAVRPQGDGQAAQSGEIMAFCLCFFAFVSFLGTRCNRVNTYQPNYSCCFRVFVFFNLYILPRYNSISIERYCKEGVAIFRKNNNITFVFWEA